MAAAGILEVQGRGTKRSYALDGRPVSLGRAPDNAVVLDHASVSRYHARIEWIETQPQLVDLGSANGTRVNDTAIAPNAVQPLAPGDRIQIVDFELALREPATGQAERRDLSGQVLPSVEPALLTHAEPASVSLLVNTRRRAKRYPIEEASVTIGRDPASDICIDEPVVSWRHARLERVANGYQIVDLDSSNGLTCQGVEVAEMLLADGEALWIASDVRLTYSITPLVPEAETPGLEEALRSPAERPVLDKAPAPRAAEAPVFKRVETPAPAAETPILERVSPPPPPPAEKPAIDSGVPVVAREAIREEAAPLHATMLGMETPSSGLQKIDMRERRELTIGRSPENDLQLSYPTISRHHARIRRVGDGEAYVIEDLDSSNGTVVNDAPIEPGELHPLRPGSTLRIGPIKLIFAPDTVQFVDESRDLRLDALHLNQFVGKGTNLLQDISLAILPREFVALVGVSGAGKSTLMNALAGFWPASDGVVLVNGTDLYRRFDMFRTDLGYVPQDDIIHKELTAEKALDYAARLRLPPDTTAAERKVLVADELKILGLTERKDVRVGSLSGGQRKRVSIGVERLTRPGLFFLDEATSGLDPGTENRLMRLLRQLADDGQTIILITHATKNVMLCDQVIFLAAGGRLAYFGPPDEALAYFGVAAFDEIYEQLEEERSPEAWAAMYQQSPQYREYVVKRLRDKYGELLDARPESPALPTREAKVKRPSPLRQFGVLAARYMDIIRTDRINLLLMLLIAPVLGAMDLIAWPRDTYDPVAGDAARTMVMLFLAVIIPFLIGALGSVREVVKERAIYRRERTVTLRIVPYLLSKVAVGFLFALYTAAALLILKLISVDFSHLGMGDLALVYLILLLAVVSGEMWGLLISAVAPREEQAMLLLIVIVVVQMVFSGGILPLDQLGTAGEVIGGITSSKWTFEAMVDVTQVQRGNCDGPSLGDCELAGVQAYETDAERQVVITHLQDRYGQVLEGDVITSMGALLGILVGLFILLAVIQKRKDVI